MGRLNGSELVRVDGVGSSCVQWVHIPVTDLIALAWSFIGIYRSHAVIPPNPLDVLEVRHREESKDWEVKLAPPVNRVLAVSDGYLAEPWRVLGEG